MQSNLHAGHRKRLKARFLAEDIDNFDEHNILELLLFYAIPQKDINELSHRLINHFGGLAEVFDAPLTELIKLDGVTDNVAILIKMIPSYSRAYMKYKSKSPIDMRNADAIGEYFINLFIGRKNEQVYLMSLDSHCQFISCDLVAEGHLSKVNINIRTITEIVVTRQAYSVVLAHNHPNGILKPSNDDVITTSWVKNALKQLDIILLDHILIANNEYISFVEIGYV